MYHHPATIPCRDCLTKEEGEVMEALAQESNTWKGRYVESLRTLEAEGESHSKIKEALYQAREELLTAAAEVDRLNSQVKDLESSFKEATKSSKRLLSPRNQQQTYRGSWPSLAK